MSVNYPELKQKEILLGKGNRDKPLRATNHRRDEVGLVSKKVITKATGKRKNPRDWEGRARIP